MGIPSIETPIFILLVEDDEVDIKDVQRQFKLLKAQVNFHIAHNGAEALDKLYGKNGEQKIIPAPQAIILDTHMPKMDGIEFLEKLRTDPDFNDVHVFLLTGNYTSREKIATRNLMVTESIVKPLQFEDVLRIYLTISGGP